MDTNISSKRAKPNSLTKKNVSNPANELQTKQNTLPRQCCIKSTHQDHRSSINNSGAKSIDPLRLLHAMRCYEKVISHTQAQVRELHAQSESKTIPNKNQSTASFHNQVQHDQSHSSASKQPRDNVLTIRER
jgi:hypothetical protein